MVNVTKVTAFLDMLLGLLTFGLYSNISLLSISTHHITNADIIPDNPPPPPPNIAILVYTSITLLTFGYFKYSTSNYSQVYNTLTLCLTVCIFNLIEHLNIRPDGVSRRYGRIFYVTLVHSAYDSLCNSH